MKFILTLLMLVSTHVAALSVPDQYIRDVLTQDLTDVQCLALNIYHEARGEDMLGQELVAQVTMNRVFHSAYPDTVCGVVRQHRQFSWTQDGRVDHPYDRGAYVLAYLIAYSFIYYQTNLSVPHATELLNFHAVYVSPRWSSVLVHVFTHQRHVFYRRP